MLIKKIKNLQKKKKEALAFKEGGFYSYNKYKCVLGSLQELINSNNFTNVIKYKILPLLEPHEVYACLINIQYISKYEGSIKGISPMKSMIITDNSNPDLISIKINQGLNEAYNNYDRSEDGIIVSVHWREWIPKEDYDKLVAPIKRTEILNKVLANEINYYKERQGKNYLDKIMKIMNVADNKIYLR